MREIKFRAWNKDTRTMVDLASITPLALDAGMNTQLAMQGASGLFIPFMKGMEIMQYTGLKDKNGVEIYEGDICGYDDPEDDSRFEVVWQNGAWRSKYPGWPADLPEYNVLHVLPGFTMVIGNIHENPELLNAGKE